MKKLILLVVLVFTLLASLTAGQVASVVSAVPVAGDALAAGIDGGFTDDTCAAVFTEEASACGGPGYTIGECVHVNYVGWVQLYWNGYVMGYIWCTPGNGGQGG